MSGVLYDVTAPWDVPLYVSRGFSSLSLVHGAAEEIAAIGKPAHIYCFGDYDPSGMEIPRVIERGMREFAPEAEVHFTRVAVTSEQIVSMGSADATDEDDRLTNQEIRNWSKASSSTPFLQGLEGDGGRNASSDTSTCKSFG